MARIVDSCFFCLPVAGWPLAGASFLFLRAAAATTKVFTSSPTNSPRISQFPGSWWFPSLSGFLYFSRCAHRRSRLFPTDNGRAIVNRTPPSRRHRPGRPLSCRRRALDADCPPQSQSPGLRSQQTAQSVPHAGFNRPSTLCARSQPAGQHSPAPPPFLGRRAAKSKPRKDASSRIFAPRVCWRVAAQSAAGRSASPHVKGS